MKRQPMPGIQVAPINEGGSSYLKYIVIVAIVLVVAYLYNSNKKQRDNE